MGNRTDCSGCEDNFYNGNNPYGVQECWSLKSAKLVTRFQLHVWTQPTVPGAFTEVRVHNCFRSKGYVFYTELPSCAIDPIRLRAVSTTKRGTGGVL